VKRKGWTDEETLTPRSCPYLSTSRAPPSLKREKEQGDHAQYQVFAL
jgi:hypothetical protein